MPDHNQGSRWCCKEWQSFICFEANPYVFNSILQFEFDENVIDMASHSLIKFRKKLTFCNLTILSVTRSWTSFEANPYVFTWRRWCGAPWWPSGDSPPTGTPRSPRSASWWCCTRPAAACYLDSHYKRQIFVEQLYKTQQHCCVV